MIRDVAEADFQTQVIDRSHEVPVVVDFWAEWCGPCRQLGPALESEAASREGEIDLAKVDVDANQGVAGAFGVQGIPAVKAFKDGKLASEFTGAIPPAQVKAFFDALVPSEAERLASSSDEAELRRALELNPRQAEAATNLGRILVARGDHEEATELLGTLEGDFLADGLLARVQLTGANGDAPDLAAAFSAWDDGDHEAALETLQTAIAAAADSDRKDALRRVMVAIFTDLGPESDLARDHRRRLAAVL